MPDHSKSSLTWSSLGWIVPLAFLALPDCGFDAAAPRPNLDRGPAPNRTAVLCDVEGISVARRCATGIDIALGARLHSAAVDLIRNRKNTVALDYRPGAPAEAGLSCPPGVPVAITFRDFFPHGGAYCMNAEEMIGPGRLYQNADAACQAACLDQVGSLTSDNRFYPENPPSLGTALFCSQHARASTNAAHPGTTFGLLGGCTDAGAQRPDFFDPRRIPEKVHWRDRVGVVTSGGFDNTLTRTAPDSGAFDAGAASVQAITLGDGWVEFTAAETGTGRACGLSTGSADAGNPDLDPTLDGIGFAVRLGSQGAIFILESGVVVPGPDPTGSFGQYAAGDRIRIMLEDNHDGTATLSYHLIPAACSEGPLCTGVVLRSGAGPAAYPFRVDASLRNPGATLTRVEMVRIEPF